MCLDLAHTTTSYLDWEPGGCVWLCLKQRSEYRNLVSCEDRCPLNDLKLSSSRRSAHRDSQELRPGVDLRIIRNLKANSIEFIKRLSFHLPSL